jgi:hypothetical protein
MNITTKDKLQCVERELAFRHCVYERLMTKGRMSPNQARQEIWLMEAIVEDYRGAVAAEEPEFALDIETRRTINERR